MVVNILFATEEIAFGPVGFSAYSTDAVRYEAHETIIFENVVTNYGGAYNSDTGNFTCPVTGYYDVCFSSTVGRLKIYPRLNDPASIRARANIKMLAEHVEIVV